MNTNTRTAMISLGIIVVLIFIIVAIFYTHAPQPANQATSTASSTTAAHTVLYACNANKTINASYYEGEGKPAAGPNQPPVPGGGVILTLSDGRNMTLPRTISADGLRYANADESIIFWSKGNGVTFTENNKLTYAGCIQMANDPGGLSKTYQNASQGFSLRYPAGYTVDESYRYQALGPGKDIHGTKFTIPMSVATGTNLSTDSYISVEEIPQVQNCSADLFLEKGVTARAASDSGTDYSVASSTGAAAGNRYEETVYALPGTNPCMAVRYFVHYGVLENYPAGVVHAFDKPALINQFDAIRRTLTVLK